MKPIELAERGYIPTFLIRAAIHRRVARKCTIEASRPPSHKEALIASLTSEPVAIATDEANDQHYEVPTAFYRHFLGPRMKYSACFWPDGVKSLAEAEEASLRQVAERALLTDGQSILELGCGWGSFSLWAAEHFPTSTILAISNSRTQADYIRSEAAGRGLKNLQVVTENMVRFDPGRTFDRIVSIEMLEHMRNYPELFQRIASWLNPDGKCFVHIFSHHSHPFFYNAEDPDEWMAQTFFTGGIMPSHDLFGNFSDDLTIEADWRLNGTHYSRTLEAWLQQLDKNRAKAMPILESRYPGEARIWFNRWRLFILACSGLFGYRRGTEWAVSHYRFTRTRS